MQYRSEARFDAATVNCSRFAVVFLLVIGWIVVPLARPAVSASAIGGRVSSEKTWRVICLLQAVGAEITFRLDPSDDPRTFRLRDVIRAPKSKSMTLLSTTSEWVVVEVKLHPRFATDTILAWCKIMGDIESIDLSYCYNVSDIGIADVSQIHGLRKVFLSDNNPVRRNNFVPHHFDLQRQKRLTDKTLYYLSQCSTLEELYSYDIQFTNDGLKSLYNHPSLKVLVLRGVKATLHEVAELRAHLPKCRVEVILLQEGNKPGRARKEKMEPNTKDGDRSDGGEREKR